jgi:hypothetical protein
VRGKTDLPGVARVVLGTAALLTSHLSPLTSQIQDNSFLLEEAYNQEAGVVQHISTFARSSGGDWVFSFTQEWPLGGLHHQLSYTIPVENNPESGSGLADVALNYRYQLAGDAQARTLIAPRLSLLLPTGNEKENRGMGGVGFQLNLPLTLVLGSAWVTHWNGGMTLTPSARNSLGNRATTRSFNLGASVVWLIAPRFNLLLESVRNVEEMVLAEGKVTRRTEWILNPGLRGALNLGDLQVVPGAAYSIGVGKGPDENGVFVYLSLEHPFRRQ